MNTASEKQLISTSFVVARPNLLIDNSVQAAPKE